MSEIKFSLAEVLRRRNGIGPGFDVMRLALATAVFVGHAKWLSGFSENPFNGLDPSIQQIVDLKSDGHADPFTISKLKRVFHLAILAMFFALSGFLVTGSAYRLKNVKNFLAFRVLRILPALSVEVTLSAIVIGPLFTSLTLEDYFFHKDFMLYFGNIFGFVYYHLPGVFTTNPTTSIINNNLWTLPGEFYCYILLASLMLSGLFFNRIITISVYILITFVLIVMTMFFDIGLTGRSNYGTSTLVYYFFTGCLVYQWRDKIPFDHRYAVFSALISILAMYFQRGVYIAPFFLTYLTVYIGLMSWPKMNLIQSGDYSYGLYLYGFPITQAVIAAYPRISFSWYVTAFVSGLITIFISVLSWHFIERPILKLKRFFTGRIIPQTPSVRMEGNR